MENINAMLQKFWEVNHSTSGTEQVSLLKFEDKLVLDMAEKFIEYNNDYSYKIAVPWKEKLIILKWQKKIT